MPWNEQEMISLASRWIALHPTTLAPRACRAVADELAVHLAALGFTVEVHSADGYAPLLAAHRPAPPGRATVGVYGHYDVEPVGDGWRHDPLALRLMPDRLYGRGIADNLGPLALRILAAREVSRWPGVLWVIEGGEEVGSPMLANLVDEGPRLPEVALWLDETGYFVDRSTQRVLTLDWTARLSGLDEALTAHARAAGVETVCERRRLRRVPGAGAAAVERMFERTPYLAIGPNDPEARVHAADESLPRWSLALSASQFVATLEWFADGGAS